MTGSRHMARRSVVLALYRWELTGQLESGVEDSFLDDWGLEGVDQENFKQLAQANLKYRAELDRNIEQ